MRFTLLQADRNRPLAAIAIALLVLAGCGGSSDDAGVQCGQMGGAWDVSIDFGNGLVAQQRWTITQTQCELRLVADPPDAYGPALSAATGAAGQNGLWATWTITNGACRCYSSLDASVSGNTLRGTIGWSRGPYGAGFCSGALGSIAVTGTRR